MSSDFTESLRQRKSYDHALKGDCAPSCASSAVSSPSVDFAACLLTAAELEGMDLPKRTRLLDKWLCQADLGYIFAPRGVGKTWLGMALPMALSQGRELGQWEAGERPCGVLYVDGEMPLELTQYRSRGLGLGRGQLTYLHHEMLFDQTGASLNIARLDHREALTRTLIDQGYECLILDNLSSLASGVDENKGNEYEPIGQWLLELRRRKITVIIIHHAGRNGFMRGHSKREDACSWILELRDAKVEGESGAKFISHFAKPSRNTGDPMPDLLWHFTSDQDGRTEIRCETAQTTEYEQLIQHVIEGVERQVDIAELMGKTKGTICKWTNKALKEGRISGSSSKLLPPKTNIIPMHRADIDG